MSFDDIVKDSSIWRDNYSFRARSSIDTTIRIGIVRNANFNEINQEPTYIVEVQNEGDKHFVPCKLMRRFGGVYNTEEYTLQTYNADRNNDQVGKFETKAGDQVVVAFLNGDPREGLIIGGLNHTARKARFKPEDGPQLFTETNGVQREINKDGEYTVTFRGIPTNASVLKDKPGNKVIPEAEYDDEVGTTYYKFDVDGGWTVSDNATQDPQTVHINKKDGEIIITSGKIELIMVKGEEATSLQTKTLDITSTDSISNTTSDWVTDASSTARLKSPKIAIGHSSTELLDQLVKLIDAIGTQTVITPVGPAAPVSASPQWAQVEQIKSAINSIRGSL